MTLVIDGTWRVGPDSHRLGIADMAAVRIDETWLLLTQNGPGGGAMSLSLGADPGRPSLREQVSFPDPAGAGQDGRMALARLGDQWHLLLPATDGAGALQSRVVVADGTLGAPMSWAGTAGKAITAIAFDTDSPRAVTAHENGNRLASWGVGDPPRLAPGDAHPATATGDAAETAALAIARTGGESYALALSGEGPALHSLWLDGAAMEPAGLLDAGTGMPLGGPVDLVSVTLAGRAYALAAGALSSSITVARLEPGGALTPTDHVIDDLGTRFAGLQRLAAVDLGDRVYIAAGGRDDGLTLLQLLPDGRLLHVATRADPAGAMLTDITAVTGLAHGGRVALYAAGASEPGITRLTHDPGPLAPMRLGGTGADRLEGDGRGDLLFGRAGDDRLEGQGGADILMDGGGADTLTGGPGADTFVLSGDGAPDRITDFEPGKDRIDLTGWGRVYDIGALDIRPVNGGADIRFGTETLFLRTAGGGRLDASDFTAADLFPLWHVAPAVGTAPGGDGGGDGGGTGPDPHSAAGISGGPGAEVLNGTGAAEHLDGRGGNDTLRGQGGNDLLTGGPGRDVLEGGPGRDTVSYVGSVGSLRVDLMYPVINTNLAAGDSYDSIENLYGSQGFDNLRGTLEANVIEGWRNVDYIFGRRGDDTLIGGIGDDVLFGGPGADVLIGGEHRDRAQYSESLTALELDLQYPGRNTGEAEGDSYDGIEDLAGGWYSDLISGDSGANRLFGREGEDTLIGRLGDDYLNGGAMRDRLVGGPGNDTLRGGQSHDTFVYDGGADVIEDFAKGSDRLEIDNVAFGNAHLTVAEVMGFAEARGGDTVFVFSGANTLTLLGVGPAGLGDDLAIV